MNSSRFEMGFAEAGEVRHRNGGMGNIRDSDSSERPELCKWSTVKLLWKQQNTQKGHVKSQLWRFSVPDE
jgi:hypothetical protein